MPVFQSESEADRSGPTDPQAFGSESVTIRNYDATEAHTLAVTVTDPHDEVVVDRSVTVEPANTLSLQLPLERAVYQVGVTLDYGISDSIECLIGSNLEECAVIECGNGIISVTAGYYTHRS